MNIRQWEETPLSSASRKECLKAQDKLLVLITIRDEFYAKQESLKRLREKAAGLSIKGWFCEMSNCRLFNGEEKERLYQCRGCGIVKPF